MQIQNTNKKTNIRVFVSSTFKDLAIERNYLMRKTFPLLREMALKYGVSITGLDLRWGITGEESKLGKVLQICLEEVDNSVPFFIGIIGTRYGWIPSLSDINEEVLNEFPEVETYLRAGISITEMEIMYGVMNRKHDMHALFFISKDEPVESVDSKEYEKLIKLRDLVLTNNKYPVYRYTKAEDISQTIEEYFATYLEKTFSTNKKLSFLESELFSQYLFAKTFSENIIARDMYYNEISNWLRTSNKILLIKGENGLGKSTLIAHWIVQCMENQSSNIIVIPQFVGIGGNHNSGDYIKDVILKKLSQYVEPDIETSGMSYDLDKQLANLVKTVPQHLNFIIVIDGIDQIAEEDKPTFLKWLPAHDDINARIVISSVPNDINAKKLVVNGASVLEICPMGIVDKHDFIIKYLSSHAKKLDNESTQKILHAKIFGNTLALKTLMDTVILFSNFESIKDDISQYVTCSSIGDFYKNIFTSFDNEFSYNSLKEIYSYIYVSKRGLFEEELIELCDITPLVWTRIHRLLKGILIEETGKIRFAHNHISNAVKKHYFKDDNVLVTEYVKRLISYMEKKEHIRTRNELPFLYAKVNMLDSLYQYILCHDVALYFLENDQTSFLTFWRKLENRSSSFKILDYLDNVDCQYQDFLVKLGSFSLEVLKDYESSQIIYEYNFKQSKKASDDFQKAMIEIANEVEGIEFTETPDCLQFAGSFCNLGNTKYDEGLYEEALHFYYKAVGVFIDDDDFYDYSIIDERTNTIALFYEEDSEFFRVAYMLCRLGNTYDELGHKQIACLMFQRAESYFDLLSDKYSHFDFLAELYHNWAISQETTNPNKAISLLKKSISISKQLGNIDNVLLTLCAMGSIYKDQLLLSEKALECYNKAIDMGETFGKTSEVLGDLYHNRSFIWADIDKSKIDLNKSISIYQMLLCTDKIIGTYKSIAIIYFNRKYYVDSLRYYLICYHFSCYFYGENNEQTLFYEKEVIESFQIVAHHNMIKNIEDFETLTNLTLFFHRKGIEILDISNLQSLIQTKIMDAFKSKAENEGDNVLYRKLYFILQEITIFYKTYFLLPKIENDVIGELMACIYQNGDFYVMVLDAISTIDNSNVWVEYDTDNFHKLCAYSFYTYLQVRQDLLPASIIIDIVESVEKEAVPQNNSASNDLMLIIAVDAWNDIAYETFVQKGQLKDALIVTELVLKLFPNSPDYLNTKADILFRMGKKTEALEIVKRILSIDTHYYPENNEFLYNNLKEYID